MKQSTFNKKIKKIKNKIMFYDPKNTKFKKINMCGITGFLGKNKDSPNNHQIKNCLNLMYNRGPDARGKIVKNLKINL